MASYISLKIWVLSLLVFSTTLLPVSNCSTLPSCPVKGANLGGWLVIEGWIKPSILQDIPRKEFLDGTSLQFKSVTTGKYLCAENGGGTIVVANCPEPQTFKLWRINQNTFRIKVPGNQFVGLEGTKVVADQIYPILSETFDIVRETECSMLVRIKASNGFYLQAKTEDLVTADVEEVHGWENDDPTIFTLTITGQIEGEFQVTNGYGPDKAPQVMKEHWDTFIVEDDFKFLKENGFNAVRLPVGWWTAKDPHPPAPFVGGSLVVLDRAFSWAEKYGLKIILDLHAAPGSQNGVGHSATRDGNLDWGKTDENIHETLEVIDFFTARYANHPSLYAVELLNEPLAPDVTLETLEKFSRAGYNVVRKYSKTAYVIFSVRLQFTQLDDPSPTELLPLASELERSVIDVHWYNYYYPELNDVDKNIDFIRSTRSKHIKELSKADGPPVYVGEWSADWPLKKSDHTEEDFKRYVAELLHVYGQASFGWTFWTLRIQNEREDKRKWSLEWMIKQGYIKF